MARFPTSFQCAVLGTAILLLAFARGAFAQPALPTGCDARLVVASRNLPLGYRPRAGYCDGTVREPNAGELPLLSATLGRIRFAAGPLRVRPSHAAGRLTLQASDVRPGRSYRLDGTVNASGLTIDLAAAAAPSGVTQETLGLRAWSGAGSARVYVPLVAGGSAQDDVLLVFRSDEAALRVGRWICESSGCGPLSVAARGVPDGGLIAFPIPRTGQTRQVRIKLDALHSGGRHTHQDIALIVPGR